MRKGEIACNKRLPCCVEPITTQYRFLTHLKYIAVENMRKGEIAYNKRLPCCV